MKPEDDKKLIKKRSLAYAYKLIARHFFVVVIYRNPPPKEGLFIITLLFYVHRNIVRAV
jgi:hypothetical protein